jgi:hypothetical protein
MAGTCSPMAWAKTNEGKTMRIPSSLLLELAAFSMLIALACQNITLASQDYRVILLVALGCTCVADVCCAIVLVRGGPACCIALAIALPTLFIVWDFLRRAPSTYLGGI